MLTSDMVPRKLENLTSHLFHTSIYFLRVFDGPNAFVTFSFTALQPLLLSSHASRALPRARSTSQVAFSVPPIMNTVLRGWLNDLFLQARP